MVAVAGWVASPVTGLSPPYAGPINLRRPRKRCDTPGFSRGLSCASRRLQSACETAVGAGVRRELGRPATLGPPTGFPRFGSMLRRPRPGWTRRPLGPRTGRRRRIRGTRRKDTSQEKSPPPARKQKPLRMFSHATAETKKTTRSTEEVHLPGP
jgi:hypothetical protein